MSTKLLCQSPAGHDPRCRLDHRCKCGMAQSQCCCESDKELFGGEPSFEDAAMIEHDEQQRQRRFRRYRQ